MFVVLVFSFFLHLPYEKKIVNIAMHFLKLVIKTNPFVEENLHMQINMFDGNGKVLVNMIITSTLRKYTCSKP